MTHQYAIYRYGSNSANQHLCEKMIVAVVEAKSREAAIKKALNETAITVYANQHLSAVPMSRVPRAERDAAYEDEAMRQEYEKEMETWT